MFRIDGPGATPDNKFSEGDPANGTRATVVTDEWLNSVQEEVAQSIEGDGQVLEKSDSTQLSKVFGRRVIRVGSVSESFSGLTDPISNAQYSVIAWHAGGAVMANPVGGGRFVFESDRPKSDHNGGTVISPTVPALSAQLSISDYLDGVGETDSTGTGCFVRLENHIRAVDFGAYNDQSQDSASQLSAAIAARGLTGAIELPTQLRLDSPVTLDPLSKEYRFYSVDHCNINVTHNGDGFIFDGQNENYGAHTWENITIGGPNIYFPGATYTPPSTGSGLALADCFDCTFINFKSYGFQYGLTIARGYNNKCVGDCEFMFNQIGVRLLAPDTNLNDFSGAKIRQNRVGGVLIDGTGGPPYPTGNKFNKAYIDSNIPYNDGYPTGGPGDGSTSFGIKLIRAYSNEVNAYFENQEYDIILEDQSSYNDFTKTRHAPSSDFSRLGKIAFKGAGVICNKFRNAEQISRNRTDVHIETDHVDHRNNEFLDCTGFNFIEPAISAGRPFVRNNAPYAINNGTPDGTIALPIYGYRSNPGEGTSRGTIDGIGTATATLNAQGLGEIQLGNQISAATTISAITGLKRHQFFTLWNYQNGFPVTLESGGPTDIVILKGYRNVVFNEFGQSITFWVNGLGRLYEIGRNFENQNKGTVTISDAETSALPSLPVTEPDYNYKVFVTVSGVSGSPPIEATRARVTGRNLGSIQVALEAAPGAGNSVSVDWEVVRV
ncbi:hypothetical protein Q673_06080 [Marinobacter sp. EN3]|uniref:hypothetical protein n=1 Tax=Marinobacter sp. EN3 TaxID=1397533 RepID=UPI0003B88EB8|nr:hypothetical protein [Marinobacter sp. EN3]ERS04789.1 hypothetical protein Q673_06080 [Marinobacter sp. EN3]